MLCCHDANIYTRFDQGSTDTPVWIENFHCRYYASVSRYYCDHDGLGITNCTHRKDLALSCLAGKCINYNYYIIISLS